MDCTRRNTMNWPSLKKALESGVGHKPLKFTRTQSTAAETPRWAFAGGFTGGATPVPIPNTAVKPIGPMILRQRESRSLPAVIQRTPDLPKVRGSFFGGVFPFSPSWSCPPLCRSGAVDTPAHFSHAYAGRSQSGAAAFYRVSFPTITRLITSAGAGRWVQASN